MGPPSHCNVCQLCAKPDQFPGSINCGKKIADKFNSGYWHNGLSWLVLVEGRVLTNSSITAAGLEWKRARRANKGTTVLLVKGYSQEHEAVLLEWNQDISGFQRQENHLELFVSYITSHPFSQIVEYRVDGALIGFNWVIKIGNLVVHQLFPWRKKRYPKLNLGKFSYQTMLEIWPESYHFLGLDTELKKKLGGWAYHAISLQHKDACIVPQAHIYS